MDIRKRNGKSGMTLIEILIVVALLGVLAGVLVRSLGGSLEAGKKATAKLFCTTTARSAIEAYKAINNQKLPTDMNQLKPYLGGDEGLKDPWGNNYQFKSVSCASGAVNGVVIYSGKDPSTGESNILTDVPEDAAKKAEAIAKLNSNIEEWNIKAGNNVCGVHF